VVSNAGWLSFPPRTGGTARIGTPLDPSSYFPTYRSTSVGKRERKVSVTRVIPADRQAIFDLLADPAMHARIDGSGTVRDVQEGGPERLSEGAKFGMDMKMGASYKVLNTVVEFEEGERIAWRHFHGHRWRYELEDVDGGTKVTETFDWGVARFPPFYEWIKAPTKNHDSMVATLERLAALVEGSEA
jgi:uncharacterized protein YndB with AHSA1/START domain